MAEGIFECVIQHRGPNVEKGLHSRPIPANLLFLTTGCGFPVLPVRGTVNDQPKTRIAVSMR